MENEIPVLETKNVTKIYSLGSQKITALQDICLKVSKGEFISIVGKSGSGKSTLMHLIGLLDTPSDGEIYLNGLEVSKFSENKLANFRNKEIGFVFQSFNLLTRTNTLNNVMLPLAYSKVPKKLWRGKTLDAIKIVGLEDRVDNKSNELSGGQKQRVAIARALVNNPSILLADEPTGNLDSKTGDEIFSIFEDLNKQGTTIIIVTHDEDLAARTKRKIVLRDGVII